MGKAENLFESFGRTSQSHAAVVPVLDRTAPLPAATSMLAYGLGRSYGDSCLNEGGTLLLTTHLHRFIEFDRATGVLRCEAGVTLEEILGLVVPQGWFLPVTPGTKFVTIGGALANDVHGKNHHRAGTIGRWIRAFELVRSDGVRLTCTPTQHREYFDATIGGLGLTGLVTWIELQLRPVANAGIEMESVRFGGLDEFFDLNGVSERDFEYTVSWIDCTKAGRSMGRGHYLRGNHAAPQFSARVPRAGGPLATFPIDAPGFAISSPTVKAFNFAYFQRQQRRVVRRLQHYDPFFYPLDGVHGWQRIYGKRGFIQYQCVVPFDSARERIRTIIEEIVATGHASFLVVLKSFGMLPSPGLLSFPRPGVTLAIDFADRGDSTRALFARLDSVVFDAGGALYPAKDGRMTGDGFRRSFPAWERFSKLVDPAFSSSFWRRVMADGPSKESP